MMVKDFGYTRDNDTVTIELPTGHYDYATGKMQFPVLNEENLRSRIRNLRKQDIDTREDESLLAMLIHYKREKYGEGSINHG